MEPRAKSHLVIRSMLPFYDFHTGLQSIGLAVLSCAVPLRAKSKKKLCQSETTTAALLSAQRSMQHPS